MKQITSLARPSSTSESRFVVHDRVPPERYRLVAGHPADTPVLHSERVINQVIDQVIEIRAMDRVRRIDLTAAATRSSRRREVGGDLRALAEARIDPAGARAERRLVLDCGSARVLNSETEHSQAAPETNPGPTRTDPVGRSLFALSRTGVLIRETQPVDWPTAWAWRARPPDRAGQRTDRRSARPPDRAGDPGRQSRRAR
ncbi:MAG: hypothetical protein R3F56_24680 [Planctomycetota bacterium]